MGSQATQWHGADWTGLAPAHLEILQSIRRRLDIELPRKPYFSRCEVGELLGVEGKTLANDATPKGLKQYPVSVKRKGTRRAWYPRQDVIDWLAESELTSRLVRVHRCR